VNRAIDALRPRIDLKSIALFISSRTEILMSEPKDMIVPMLREMREENRTLHAETRRELAALGERLTAVEKAQASFKAALTADTLLARLVTGDFEQRMADLERRTQDLMGGR
jgi:hypothetical protein